MTNIIIKTEKYEPTQFAVMKRLKKLFMGKTYLTYAKETTKLSRPRPTSDLLSEMHRLIETIVPLGHPVDEYVKPALLTGSLAHEYDHVVQTFLANHKPQHPEL